ncbi:MULTISPECIES: ABC transporter substrate-binding protein [unclassified Rhodococcus (in: high G+C Gram-positive bacteria)]|uniref:ABC transporter substrate-binding protein n=1 Tax=unclassified Rhodococcus (in: high G+C Gram-positive bacteria) TaxID=192944 RepID=UPI00211A68B9|nr:ABC transporter substrate-binding protein [Rhodococcus sp. 1163]
MRSTTIRTAGMIFLVGTVALTGTACTKKSDAPATAAASATSAADLGGMDALIAAAQEEGSLNLIGLPRDWAGYGNLMDNFSAKYGIAVTVDNPEASSADLVNAIKSLAGQDRAPDAVDVGTAFAISGAEEGLYAPYKVETWDSIPESQKAAKGDWYADYGGYISIGCDAAKVEVCPESFADLAKPEYKGKVALTGDPLKSNSALMAVWSAALANGGSVDDIAPGIEYFGKLKAAGNYVPVKATAATIESGETPIVVDWDYLNAAKTEDLASSGVQWTVAVSGDATIGSYYAQAVSATAPHPAAARLWQEYLYSDEGQNGYLAGYARPARLPAMEEAGTVDPALAGNLPAVTVKAEFPTDAMSTAAKNTMTQTWAGAVE